MKQELDKNNNPIGEPIIFTQKVRSNRECGSCLDHKSSSCCYSCLDVVHGYIHEGKPLPPIRNIEQCQEDMEKLKNKEKCRLIGSTITPNSLGQLMISVDSEQSYKDLIDMSIPSPSINLSHEINYFSFGKDIGLTNPLDNWTMIQTSPGLFKYKYNLGLVHVKHDVEEIRENGIQYSAELTDSYITNSVTYERPHIGFRYDLYPLNSVIRREKPIVSQLIFELCGIIGGGFTISSLINQLFHIKKKKY